MCLKRPQPGCSASSIKGNRSLRLAYVPPSAKPVRCPHAVRLVPALRPARPSRLPLPPTRILKDMIKLFERHEGSSRSRSRTARIRESYEPDPAIIDEYPRPKRIWIKRYPAVKLKWDDFFHLTHQTGWIDWIKTWADRWNPHGWDLDEYRWLKIDYAQMVYEQLFHWWRITEGTFDGFVPLLFTDPGDTHEYQRRFREDEWKHAVRLLHTYRRLYEPSKGKLTVPLPLHFRYPVKTSGIYA